MLYRARTIFALMAALLKARRSAAPIPAEKYIRFAELRPFADSPFYMSYHPDDYVTSGKHAEFDQLQRRFLAHNLTNNCGDIGRLWAFILNVKDALERGIEGDFAELGVWRGNTAAVLAHYAKGRRVYMFDTFEGFDRRDLVGVDASQEPRFSDTSLDLVRENVWDSFGACRYVKGYFPDSIGEEHIRARYAVVSLDCDLQEPMAAALDFFYPRLNQGGIMFIHDYGNSFWPGIRLAVGAFCRTHQLYPILMPDKSGSVILRKTAI